MQAIRNSPRLLRPELRDHLDKADDIAIQFRQVFGRNPEFLMDPCAYCLSPDRDSRILCVVEQPENVGVIEKTRGFRGRYHVLGGTLSPLDGVGPQDLSIDALISRAHETPVKEVILALNATVDGQTTAHYITELLADAKVKVTRLAHGVPVGGELDYLDEGTLAAAIKQRTLF